jgi:hypothetical protein
VSARRGATPHDIRWAAVEATVVEADGNAYRLADDGTVLVVRNGETLATGRWVERSAEGARVKLTPGAETYYEARSYHGRAVSDRELLAAAILAAVVGHPDAEADRRGTELSAVWSHHLALACGEEPRLVAKMYAPTETKTISHRIQHLAVRGIRIVDAP